MGASGEHYRSEYVNALQHLFEYMDELNRPPSLAPSLDQVLNFSHDLSNRLSELLNDLIRGLGECPPEGQKWLVHAIDETTNSMTTLKQLMLMIHQLRRAHLMNTNR